MKYEGNCGALKMKPLRKSFIATPFKLSETVGNAISDVFNRSSVDSLG